MEEVPLEIACPESSFGGGSAGDRFLIPSSVQFFPLLVRPGTRLGGVLGRLAVLLGRLGASWAPLGGVSARLGSILERLGSFLGRLVEYSQKIFEKPSILLPKMKPRTLENQAPTAARAWFERFSDFRNEPSIWTDLGANLPPFWLHFPRPGASWEHLGPSWGHLGPSWGPLGDVLGRLGGVLGPLGSQE